MTGWRRRWKTTVVTAATQRTIARLVRKMLAWWPMREGHTRYGAPAGTAALREAICEHLAARGVRASPEYVVVTPGAKPNLFHAFLATLSPGDEVLLPDPGFPIYASMVRFCGATP